MAATLAGTVSDFEDGARRVVSVDGADVGVFRHEGRFFAFENRCLHQGGPVCEGILMPRVEAVLGPRREARGERFSATRQHIVCPWHGWEYDIRTGRCAADPRLRLRAYDVRCDGDKVYVIA